MFFANHVDLFELTIANVVPWKPHALDKHQWPPDYKAVYAWRIETLGKLEASPTMLASAKAYYAEHPHEFIMHWMDTYDPRKSPNAQREELRGSKWVPFVFFLKQFDIISFFHELRLTGENGLMEKSRDMGATWLACGYSVWSWLYIPNDAIGWGSRKKELVDQKGDTSSIFEKIRLIIRRLPAIFKPAGLKERDHLTFMKCINPENGSSITGEIGDNIGRGGRTSLYFKDESAHYEHPEMIQASLDDNTNVQIDMSSVNGLGNVFHRKREAGVLWYPGAEIETGFTRVCIVDWSDHPAKTQDWYNRREAAAEREGLQHLFAQEVKRDYAAALENRIIPFEWIEAAIDAHLHIPCLRIPPPQVYSAGLDVADGGMDRNALAIRQWVILRSISEWGARDPGVTMRKVVAELAEYKGITVQADLIGVGSGVKTEYNRLVEDKVLNPADLKLVFWNAGGEVINPYDRMIEGDDESPYNRDFFGNFKAQAWWSLRTRFYKTFKARTTNEQYDAEELISIDSSIPVLQQLCKELAQPTHIQSTRLRTIVDKKPEGTKSPNMGDAVVQVFFPVPDNVGQAIVGSYQ